MNIEDKRDCRVKVFARYLYGHIIPSTFNTSNGGWCDWANLVRRFADFLEHPKNIKSYDMQNEIERRQEELVEFSKNTVSLVKFKPTNVKLDFATASLVILTHPRKAF